MTSSILQRWIRNPRLYPEMHQIPLLGSAPSYDWNKCSLELAKRLEIPTLRILPVAQGWKEREAMAEGLGSDPLMITLHITPLDSTAYLAINRTDEQRFLSWISEESRVLATESLKRGFIHFFLLEMLDVASRIPPLDAFSIVLEEVEELPQPPLYCIDLQMTQEAGSIWARLLLPTHLRETWVRHFANSPPIYTGPIAEALPLQAGLKIGTLSLSQEEWNQVQVGDFLLLDTGSFHPKTQEGLATLEVEGTPLWHVQILPNRLILQTMHEATMEENEDSIESQEAVPEGAQAPDRLAHISLPLTVELARLQMSLARIAALEPGNILEVPLDPTQPVLLTLRGAIIAKGELIQLGDKLGIQISSL